VAQLRAQRVRWRDAKQYCNERSLLEGLKPCYNEKTMDWDCDYAANGYRLPTEAEWEYAARAGVDGAYEFGEPDKLRQYAWFTANADQKTHSVGQKKPNRWGLHDLYGNVSEWCEDVYSATYYKESPAIDPHGPANPGKDVKRVIRGGSWKSSPEACRTTARQGEKTGDSDACFSTDYCGFRCVRRATAEELETLTKSIEHIKEVVTAQQAGVVHQQCDLHAVVQVQLAQDPGDVRFHRGHAEVELAADLGVRLAVADPERDLPLPVGEQLQPRAGPSATLVTVGAGHPGHQPPGDRR